MTKQLEQLLPLLECPACHYPAGLEQKDGQLRCCRCGADYPLAEGNVPVLCPTRAEDCQFAGIGGADYHETRQTVSTVRYSLERRAQVVVEAIEQWASSSAVERLLEIGTADGLLAQELHRQLDIATLVGVDVQRHQLLRHPFLRFQGDCEALPIQAGSFDVVVAAAVIEHLPQPKSFLAQAFRVLRPGGLLVLTCPHPFFDWLCTQVGYFKHAAHIHRFSIEELCQCLTESGFTNCHGKRFMLAPIRLSIAEWLEESRLRTLIHPFLLNQVCTAVKGGPSSD